MEESVKEEDSKRADLSFTDCCREKLDLRETDPGMYSPLALAYLGDAVYELIIRAKVVNQGNVQVNKMHQKSAALVKAQTQAHMIKLLEPELTQEERTVFKRGRNAKSVTMAKHATMAEYRLATGMEALVGYLYLSGRFERLLELVGLGLKMIGEMRTE